MKQFMTAGAALLMTTTIAGAGGIDRSGQSVGFIFGEGDQVELSFGVVDPSVSAAAQAPIPASSDATGSYGQFGFAYKQALTDSLDLAVIFDQPFGASIAYTDGPFAGGRADISSEAMTTLLNYDFGNGFSVHGGIAIQRMAGDIASLGLLDVDSSWAAGGVVGMAYERPDIALRAALTYRSAITQDFEGTENFAPVVFETELPQSVNFDFQTGIAAGTLLTFGARWVDWSEVDLTTPLGTYVDYTEDTVSYRLGIGRQLSDQLAASFTVGYEDGDGTGTTLGPTSGSMSYTVGMRYQATDQLTISGGIAYILPGDADLSGTTILPYDFEDNSAIGLGVKIGYTF